MWWHQSAHHRSSESFYSIFTPPPAPENAWNLADSRKTLFTVTLRATEGTSPKACKESVLLLSRCIMHYLEEQKEMPLTVTRSSQTESSHLRPKTIMTVMTSSAFPLNVSTCQSLGDNRSVWPSRVRQRGLSALSIDDPPRPTRMRERISTQIDVSW